MEDDETASYEYHYDEDDEVGPAQGAEDLAPEPRAGGASSQPIPVAVKAKAAPPPPAAAAAAAASSTPPKRSYLSTADYRGLSPNDLRASQATLMRDVSELLNVTEDNAAVLLIDFKWNRERLLDHFYSDPQGTREHAGAIQGVVDVGGNTFPPSRRAPATFYCPVLFEEVPFARTLSMGCGGGNTEEHRVSLEAWADYLVNAVTDQSVGCIKTTCPVSGCRCVVSPYVWRVVLSASPSLSGGEQDSKLNALARYERFLASSFVDINKTIKWCPNPWCGWAVQSLGGRVLGVKCEHCATTFCFACGEDAHAPLSCEGLRVWNEKCAGESETVNWFVANTKKCPNCTTHIEKNQGCNHLHCSVCKHDFCWICMGPWKEHGQKTGGYYACNRFEEGGAGNGGSNSTKKAVSDAANAKRELDRYIHYYTRYQAHQQSLKFASKQRADAEARMTALQQQGGQGWVDVQFISDACEQLVECRRVLMYTYAYAYQLPDGPRKDLFEHNQAMLEGNTEKLSELSELDPTKMQRSEVINYTRVTGKFLKNLLEQVQDEDLYGTTMAAVVAATAAAPSAGSSSSASGKRKPPSPSQVPSSSSSSATGGGGGGSRGGGGGRKT